MKTPRVELSKDEIDWMGHSIWLDNSNPSGEILVGYIEDINTDYLLFATAICQDCGYRAGRVRPTESGYTVTEKCTFVRTEEVVTRLEVPSGRLIIDDALRCPGLPEPDPLPSINYPPGRLELMRYHEARGKIYGNVLNTSPGVFKKDDEDSYTIGVWVDPEKFAEEEGWECIPEGWKQVAWVCTDVWSYEMMDYENWLALGGTPLEEDDQNGTRSVIEVTPGTYEFHYFCDRAGFDHHEEVVFATFHRVED